MEAQQKKALKSLGNPLQNLCRLEMAAEEFLGGVQYRQAGKARQKRAEAAAAALVVVEVIPWVWQEGGVARQETRGQPQSSEAEAGQRWIRLLLQPLLLFLHLNVRHHLRDGLDLSERDLIPSRRRAVSVLQIMLGPPKDKKRTEELKVVEDAIREATRNGTN